MEPKTISMLLGGILPAFLFGLAGICQKLSSQSGISTGAYLVTIGLGTVVMGGVFMLVQKNATFTTPGVLYSGLYTFLWTIGMAGIALAIQKYQGQISQLVPLYNYEYAGHGGDRVAPVGRMALGECLETASRGNFDHRRRRAGRDGITPTRG